MLAEPPLDRAGELIAANRDRLARGPDLLGRPWDELRAEARGAAVAAAVAYHREAGEVLPVQSDASLLLCGHQPELFHPGVWVKNFALHGLARRHGATPVNLVVDNDTVKSNLLRLPAMTVPPPPIDTFQPTLHSVPFDRWTAEVPYEERPVLDEALFASLPERAAQSWGYTPLLPAFWEEVMRQVARTPLLGERFAAARRTFERRWGCTNLELPVSRLCATEPFARFAAHLLLNLGDFHKLYNDTVRAYRRRHGVRSRNHPVPDLARDGDWLEAPLWAWRAGQARRGRLFARRAGDALELRAGADVWPTLPTDPAGAVSAWQGLEAQGLKVRSRALTNTLYARVFLGDLFIHGIGGGLYDELTDQLIRAFYGLEPPSFLVLSATLLLPLPRYPAAAEECHHLGRELRDLHWNPQRHLPADPGPSAGLLAKEKRSLWSARCHGRRERREQFQILRSLTEALRPHVAEQEEALRRRYETCRKQLDANAVLGRRDYAFCLHPAERLEPFLTGFL